MTPIKRLVWRLRLAQLGKSSEILAHLKDTQWYKREQMRDMQKEKLKKLLSHAYEHVPYYRKELEIAGVVKNAGKVNLANFQRVPLLDKATIRGRFEDLKSDDLVSRKWRVTTSGGSTGEPARLIHDQHCVEWKQAVTVLFDTWSGYTQCERKMLLWGSERDLLVGRETLKTYVGRWLRSEIALNAFCMTTSKTRDFVKRINAFKPVQILAYVESIYELSRLIVKDNLEVCAPSAIMTSAGTLQPQMRELIERAFKAPVFNRYGSREVGNIACECEHHQGLHIAAPTHYVEVLRPDGDQTEAGEVGEVVVTYLSNYAMPLIRYRIGDMAIRSEETCKCGRSWPLLERVTGRVTDTFVTNTGKQIHGEFFTHLLYPHELIRKFQVVQEDYNHVRVMLKCQRENADIQTLDDLVLNEITEQIRQVMGQRCRINYQFVDDIAPTASGKYRYTISKVPR